LVYTTKSAQWGFPNNFGMFSPVACTALAALIGQKRAAELILTGRHITGASRDIGLAIMLCRIQTEPTVEKFFSS